MEGSRRSHSSHRGEGVPAAPARKQSRHSSKARATKDKEGEKIRLVWANDEEDVFHVRGQADAHARRKHHKRISTIAAAVCGVVMLAVVGLCVGLQCAEVRQVTTWQGRLVTKAVVLCAPVEFARYSCCGPW